MIVKTRLAGDEKLDVVQVPCASATSFEVGQLISYESGNAVKLNAATEDITFLGVSTMTKVSGETYPDIVVATKGIFEAQVKSSTYSIGDALAYNATNDELEASTANTIAWAWENKTAAVTSLKVKIDVVALAKLFANNA